MDQKADQTHPLNSLTPAKGGRKDPKLFIQKIRKSCHIEITENC